MKALDKLESYCTVRADKARDLERRLPLSQGLGVLFTSSMTSASYLIFLSFHLCISEMQVVPISLGSRAGVSKSFLL